MASTMHARCFSSAITRAVLALTLALASAPVFAPTPASAADILESPDIIGDVPGASLTAQPASFTGTVGPDDTDDVFYVDLSAGDVLFVSITGPSTWYFDLFLYGPDTLGIYDPDAEFLTSSDGTGEGPPADPYPYELQWRAERTGRYYLDVYAVDGSGTYTVSWRVLPADGNDEIPGAPIGASPVAGWVGALSDVSDVYALDLSEGDVLRVTITRNDPDLWAETFLYRPGATSVHSDWFVAYSAFTKSTTPDGFTFLVPPGGSGIYYLEVDARAFAGDYTLSYSIDPAAGIFRLYGADRYETAQAVTRSMAVTSSVVIVATARNFPDALAASGLAGAYDAPLVLVDTNSVPFSAHDMLILLEPETIVIVGGTPAVSATVESYLRSFTPDVRRIQGADRYATARKVADEVVRVTGHVDEVFLARGDAFPDALAVAPLAFARAMPVLITRPTSLDSGAASFIEANDVSRVTIAGSTKAVSSGVASAVSALNGGSTTVVRRAGSDRYSTAASIAAYGVERGWSSFEWVGVATGANFPDALAGGVFAGSYGGVMLLTSPTSLSGAVGSAIDAQGGARHIAVFGSSAALGNAVYDALKSHVVP